MKKDEPTLHPMTPSWQLVGKNVELIRTHYLPLIYLFVLPSLLYVLGGVLFDKLQLDVNGSIKALSSMQITGIVLLVTAKLWGIFNLGPGTYFLLHSVDQPTKPIRHYYRHGLRYTWRLIIFNLVFGLMLIGGFLLLIIPGLIILRRYYLGKFYLVDKHLKLGASLTRAATDSSLYGAAIWGVIGVQLAFSLFGFAITVVPLIGIVASQFVVYGCIYVGALRYREIEPEHHLAKNK